MVHQNFEHWRNSEDGPHYHELTEDDLHNAFDAGMELGAEREAPSKPVRILRLLEYVYEDAEMAETDMTRWQMPAIGTKRIGYMSIKSTILADLNFEGTELGNTNTERP
jgi:hypothetical protein